MWDIFLGEHAKNKSPTLMTVQHCAKWTCRFIFAQEPWKWNSIIALQLFALKIIFLQAIKLKSNHIILFAIFSWLEVSCVSTLKLVWDFFLLLTISYYKAPKKCKFKWNGHCRLWFSVVLGWYSAQVGGVGNLLVLDKSNIRRQLLRMECASWAHVMMDQNQSYLLINHSMRAPPFVHRVEICQKFTRPDFQAKNFTH